MDAAAELGHSCLAGSLPSHHDLQQICGSAFIGLMKLEDPALVLKDSHYVLLPAPRQESRDTKPLASFCSSDEQLTGGYLMQNLVFLAPSFSLKR